MSDGKPSMERVTITLPPALLQRIDQDRERAGGKRSSFIVRILETYYRRRDREERDEVKTALVEILKGDEFKEIVQGALERRDTWGPVRSVPPDQRPLPIPPHIGERPKRTKSDSIPITDDMKELMRKFLENEDRPVRTLIRRDYGVDTSDIHRWLSGEKRFMRAGTWKRLKPVLERFSGE
jgi:hypothetical protein